MTRDAYTIDHLYKDQVDPTEAAAVEAVIRDYIDGWHTSDAQPMERSLHHDLVKQTLSTDDRAPGDLNYVTKTRMVQLTRDGGGRSPDADADAVVHHVEEGNASAQVATETIWTTYTWRGRAALDASSTTCSG